VSDIRYLIDNNVLSKLSLAQRSSQAFRARCVLPSEVLFEASGFPDIEALSQLEAPVTPQVLQQLQRVMRTVSVADFTLVDLYANKGNADPILIATALDKAANSADTLFPEEWRIVTDDVAVQRKAAESDVRVMSSGEFLARLAAIGADGPAQ
jgi:hypothetical protein